MAPDQDYRSDENCALVVFDLRIPGAVERYNSERAAWQDRADVEMLDLDHAVLIVRPGFAGEGTRW